MSKINDIGFAFSVTIRSDKDSDLCVCIITQDSKMDAVGKIAEEVANSIYSDYHIVKIEYIGPAFNPPLL